jgi:peptidoglycan hydrolase CwlO-like protein
MQLDPDTQAQLKSTIETTQEAFAFHVRSPVKETVITTPRRAESGFAPSSIRRVIRVPYLTKDTQRTQDAATSKLKQTYDKVLQEVDEASEQIEALSAEVAEKDRRIASLAAEVSKLSSAATTVCWIPHSTLA